MRRVLDRSLMLGYKELTRGWFDDLLIFIPEWSRLWRKNHDDVERGGYSDTTLIIKDCEFFWLMNGKEYEFAAYITFFNNLLFLLFIIYISTTQYSLYQNTLTFFMTQSMNSMNSLRNAINKLYGPKPEVMLWAYTAIIRPQFLYGCYV